MRMHSRGLPRSIAFLALTVVIAGAADRLVAQKLDEPAPKSEAGSALPDQRPPSTQQVPDNPAVVEIGRRFLELENEDNKLRKENNELRKEILQGRSKLVDWWLAGVAVLQTLFGIGLAIAGFFGFRRFHAIEKEARESASAAGQQADRALSLINDIETKNQQATSIVKRMEQITSETVSEDLERADEVARNIRNNPAATLVHQAIANAISLQGAGDSEAAIEKWRSIANISEGVDADLAARSWFSIGYLLQETSNPESAIAAYDRALQMNPDSATTYNNRGIAKGNLGRHDEALADFDEAIRLKPDFAMAYNNRGNAKRHLARHDEALADFDKAIRLKPDFALAYSNRGYAKDNLGQRDEAFADYDEAIRLKPDLVQAYYNRGNTNGNLGRHDEALADFGEAIRLKPDLAEAYNNRGNTKGNLGRHDEALADFDEAIRLKPDFALAYSNRGYAKDNLGQRDEALADYDEAIRLKPDLVEAYYNRGNTNGNLGRHDEALADYDAAIRLRPDYMVAYFGRAGANIELGRISKARQDIETTLALAQEKGDEERASAAQQVLRGLLDGNE